MTFGNLGENFELSAIKSAGISLIRVLKPIFFFHFGINYIIIFFNNYVVPAANLKAYSLIYDIKHKKPALDIKKGFFTMVFLITVSRQMKSLVIMLL